MKNDRLSVAELRVLLRVDQETGHLYWLHREACGRSPLAMKWFNKHCAGKRADLSTYPSNGYARVRLTACGKKIAVSAHRIVFALVHGRWPALTVDHIDGNRTNNRPSNLRELSAGDNIRAAWARRRKAVHKPLHAT